MHLKTIISIITLQFLVFSNALPIEKVEEIDGSLTGLGPSNLGIVSDINNEVVPALNEVIDTTNDHSKKISNIEQVDKDQDKKKEKREQVEEEEDKKVVDVALNEKEKEK